MTEQLEITINAPFGKYQQGSMIVVESKDGIPVDRCWRRRIRDAKVNGCVSVKVRGTNPDLVIETPTEIDAPVLSDKAAPETSRTARKKDPKKVQPKTSENEK